MDVILFINMWDAVLIRSESGSSRRVVKQVLRFRMAMYLLPCSFKVSGIALVERSICPFVRDLFYS